MGSIRLAVGVALILLSAGCGGSDDAGGGDDGDAATTTAAGSATTAQPTIGVADFTFQPAAVAPGVTVRLANGDPVAHTVESRDGAWAFDEASQTFTAPSAPGAYAIFCGIHPSMTGTLTVA